MRKRRFGRSWMSRKRIGLAATLAVVAYLSASQIWGAMSPTTPLLGPCLWRGSSKPRLVALTFDDGPDPRWTPRILEILRKEHVPATFFLEGENVAAHPELARAERNL